MGKILNWSTEEKTEAELKELMRTKNMRDTNKIARGEMVEHSDDDMVQKEMESADGWEDKKVGDSGSNENLKGFDQEDAEIQQEKIDKQLKKEANKIKRENRNRIKALTNADEWHFENVVEIFRNNELVKYQATANIEVLATYFDSPNPVLVYNGELQRGYRKNSKGDLLAVRSKKQVDLIYESIILNKMHGGFITLNWNPEKGDINYDEDEHTISGLISQKLDILDGQHRLSAFAKILKAYKRSPESIPNPSEYQIGIVIEMLDDNSAKSLFSEYATKSLKISKSRGEYLNVEDNTNKLCREIMKKSDIKVEVISTAIKANSENIITFGVLSKIVKENYDPKTKMEIEGLSNYLTMFIDSLIFTFPTFMASKNLEERVELRKQYLTMEPLAWGGYIKISKQLQGKSRDEILSILAKFNAEVEYKGFKGKFLEKENPIFRKIMRENFKIINTSSSVTWINKVFVDYALEGKSLEEIGKES